MFFFIFLIAPILGNPCQIRSPGAGSTWIYAIADGVRDYYHTGVPLNEKYFCFDGCLNSGTVVQSVKAKLAPKPTWSWPDFNETMVEIFREKKSKKRLGDPNDYDENALTCKNDTLRREVYNALQNVVDLSAKGIARTLQYSLNLPGWVYIVVEAEGAAIDGFFPNDNFCLYIPSNPNSIYEIRILEVDTS